MAYGGGEAEYQGVVGLCWWEIITRAVAGRKVFRWDNKSFSELFHTINKLLRYCVRCLHYKTAVCMLSSVLSKYALKLV